ncbi:Serine/threonine-protein phosphatase 5, partial [Geodia barretti]
MSEGGMESGEKQAVSEEYAAKAETMKNKANEFFKSQRYQEAIEWYSKAIDLDPSIAVYYGNRSFAHLKMESYGYALSDATTALDIDRTYIKGYYRRASANMALGKFKKALTDFEAVKKARPKDQDAVNKYNQCNKIVHQQAFAKAIAVESSKKSVAESINLDTMVVEETYEGPRWEEGEMAVEFMTGLLDWLKEEKKLHRKYAYKILLRSKEIFEAQPSLVAVSIPDSSDRFTVCGDIHGQFYDLLNIFTLNGLPSQDNPYLFNGDFVDRGSFSVEVILSLLGFKVLYPDHFFMSRGNHESINMNQMYGFEGEVRAKYSQQMWDLFTEIFNWLPLAHLLQSRVLVTHGGLFSRDGVKVSELVDIDRNRQPPEEGLMC